MVSPLTLGKSIIVPRNAGVPWYFRVRPLTVIYTASDIPIDVDHFPKAECLVSFYIPKKCGLRRHLASTVAAATSHELQCYFQLAFPEGIVVIRR